MESQGGSTDEGGRRAENGADDAGPLLWDFLETFVAARHAFLCIHRHYDGRVLEAARAMGVGREFLVLPPRQLFDLFHLRRLELLRDARLRPLRDLARRIFAEQGHEELLDVYCSHIYHELSILSEEHRSVGRFLHIHDPRRYRQLFEEVSGYYPMRLRRIRRLFTGGLRRIEILLPAWARHRVIVRSMYLFGDRLAAKAYGGRGVDVLYRRMYPEGVEIEGYLQAARSFRDSGFLPRALRAAEQAVEAGERLARRRPLERAEQGVFDSAQDLLARLRRKAAAEAAAP